MDPISKKDFKYARLFTADTGEYTTDPNREDLVMGPQTARRFEENADDCAVTVCCITYNQEAYIAQALESFVCQKTNFRFKVFVGEDHGPDGTADIVREYAKKYPDIIVPFCREQNMGAQANLIDLINRANSPYIAFCEGDDYWIDEYKLQKQFDYMQANPKLRVCFTRTEIEAPEDWALRSYYKQDSKGRMIMPETIPGCKMPKGFVDATYYIYNIPIHTSTHFYRWNYDLYIPDWFYEGVEGAFPIMMMQMGLGLSAVLPDVTSVYRRSDVGVLMYSNKAEHFLSTRMDYIRFLSNVRDYFVEYYDSLGLVSFNNRIKAEAYNYLSSAISADDDEAIRAFVEKYPQAFRVALGSYLSFYRDSRALINAATWDGYRLIAGRKRYRLLLRPYGKAVVFADKCEKKGKQLVKSLKKPVSWACYWGYSVLPKKKNRWAITNFKGRGYFDNAKYFYEYVTEHHPEIELTWFTKDKKVYEQLTEEHKPVLKFRSLKGILSLATSAVAVVDHNVMSDFGCVYGFNHRTKVVQLWHGVGFKAMGDGKEVKTVQFPGVQYSYDILPQPGDSAAVRARKAIKYFFTAYSRELFERYFLFVCPGQERIDMIAKVWNIPMSQCFMAGHPRDINSYRLKPDPAHPKVMYAPTFRYEREKEVDLLNQCIEAFPAIQKLMEEVDGYFVLRLHPLTWRNYSAKLVMAMKPYDRISRDEEKDVYTSLGTYDIVISDYSSISLDFAVLDRPTVYYCPDIQWFRDTQAGFNLDFEGSIPGPIVYDWSDVLRCVRAYLDDPSLDSDMRKERIRYFFDLSVNGEDNSERITQEIKRRLGIG